MRRLQDIRPLAHRRAWGLAADELDCEKNMFTFTAPAILAAHRVSVAVITFTPAAASLPFSTAHIRMMASAPFPMVHEKRLLRGVLIEALEVQEKKRFGLEQQRLITPEIFDEDEKARAKALRRAEQVPLRLAEVAVAEQRLVQLQAALAEPKPDLIAVRSAMEGECGLGSRLASFDVDARASAQHGRPDGFDGLVIASPRGVPILVARQTFADETLRRVSRGTDLWFQARADHKGSRVLLRTSMCRHLARSPRECQEMAADLAAFFCTFRCDEEVEVMFTDSRHVAKRGARVGQMKDSKRLGTMWARPDRVATVARNAQEEQGWLR
jgi:hypothetical protein